MSNIKARLVKSLAVFTLLAAGSAQAGNLCNQVWSGTVERLRVQEQASGETVMRLYVHPGNNADYAGYVTSEFMADVLMKAKDKDVEVTGYTDSQCKIKWVDYR